jgi:glycosyltransferase involved in cell wall biosynthesis
MKIALLTEIPAPYRIPLWNALAAVDDVELRVVLLSEQDPRRDYDLHRNEWRFDAIVLSGRGTLLRRRWLVVNRGLRRQLKRFSADVVVIGGWNQPAFFQAALRARRGGTPTVLWVESTARDVRPGNLILERLKRWLVNGATAVLVPGRAAAEYVQALGVHPERIAVAPNAVDLTLFSSRVEEGRRRRDEVRRELGLNGCCVLCVSRLSREKGVDVLVRAFAGVAGELVVIGDGPQEEEVRRLAGPNVRFLGRLPRDALPHWYAAVDAFALASRSETWGMALSEAATAGLPLVVSEAVGAAYDLVEPGVNGFRVPVEDEESLRHALERIAEDEPFRVRAGVRSRELVAGATPEHWADVVAQLSRALTG